jgi:hypothetical protein
VLQQRLQAKGWCLVLPAARLQGLLSQLTVLLDHLHDSGDTYADADTETFARRIRRLIRGKIDELNVSLPHRPSESSGGSG